MSFTVVHLERCLAEVSHWMSANHLKLNSDGQSCCVQVRSRDNCHWAAGAYLCRLIRIVSRCHTMLSLQIDSDSVTVSYHVRVSARSSRPTSAWINMFPAFVQHVSTGVANFYEFDCHCTTSSPGHLSTILSKPGWTTGTVTWYSLVQRGLLLTDCSGYLMPLHAWSVECASTTMDGLSQLLTCTGSMWQIESGTSSPSQSTGVCIIRRHST